MGSWNATCGVTQLPILCGDEIALILLVDNEISSGWDPAGHCYSNQYWTPRSIHLYGTYDDYGRYDIQDDWSRQYVLDCFQQDIVEVPVGDNEYHDGAVSRKDVKNWDFIQEAMHEGRISINSHGGKRNISQIAVHRAVFDEMVNVDYKFWNGTYSVDSVMKDAHSYIDALREYMKQDFFNNKDDQMSINKIAQRRGIDAAFMFFSPDRTIFSEQYCHTGGHNFDSVAGTHNLYKTFLVEYVDDPKLDEILLEMSKFAMFSAMFSWARKTWMPQSGLGSQGEEFTAYEAIERGSSVIMKRNKEREEAYRAEYPEEFEDE